MTSAPIPSRPSGPHWVVGNNYRVRILSYAYAATFLLPLLRDQGVPGWMWGLVLGYLFVYPHLAWLRAVRSRDPLAAELSNMVFDSAVWGALCAALGFPPWASFTLLVTSLVNNTMNQGAPGVVRTIAAFAGGGGAVFLLGRPDWPSAEPAWVAGLAGAGALGYLFAIALVAHGRIRRARGVREQLRQRESELRVANAALGERVAEVERLSEELAVLANRDPLTDLYNRRHFQDSIAREIARCRRASQPMSLVLLDIDHFKSINDRFGHATGDEVIRRLGALLRETVRQEDFACRIGGEEFALLMPTMPGDVALKRAEAFRERFAALRVDTDGGPIGITLSAGVATFPADGDSPDTLMREADRALYAAKRAGRNAVVAAGTAVEPGTPRLAAGTPDEGVRGFARTPEAARGNAA
ncbi:MAG: hypothetical protein RIS35_3784 [Pseudomonadota bacterium]|jgi:diguanylate cyclase (GGDEF)-like protein